MNIVCLATENDPAVGYWLRGLIEGGHENLTIIFDRKHLHEDDIARWDSRTGAAFPAISLDEFEHLPMYWVRTHNGPETEDLLRRSYVALNCGTPRRLRGSVLSASPMGIINVHPGRLPEYRGKSAVEWALHNKERVFVTAHLMDTAIDAGKVIAERDVGATDADSYHEVRCKTHAAAFDLMPKAIDRLMADDFEPLRTIGPTDGVYRQAYGDVDLRRLIIARERQEALHKKDLHGEIQQTQ